MRPFRPDLFQGRSSIVLWVSLAALSLVLVVIAESIKLPAALLIGPMVGAMLIAAGEGTIRVSQPVFVAAQGLIGTMIGTSIPVSILRELGSDWPIFVFGVLAVIAAASGIGLVLARHGVLPGTTAIWGTSPGASTSMIIMSEAYGADLRLVAVMQYMRIVAVAMVATLASKLWIGSTVATAHVEWFPAIETNAILATLTMAVGIASAAAAVRIPAGALLVPLATAMIIKETGWFQITLPPWLMALSYAIIGWSIGLRFTRPIIAHAFWALPKIIAANVALLTVCALIAAVLVVGAGVDPLTAFLATCPGGLDSVAIIAAASPVDRRFVMTMQTMRLLVALGLSPAISRYLAERQQGSAEVK